MSESRVYVGTYGKYNNGSIAGAWLDLDDYTDKDDFYEACAELHNDENDPEFMFQDYEGIPDGMISESHINDATWEWLALDDYDRDKVEFMVNDCGYDPADAIANVDDCEFYEGMNLEELAEHFVDEGLFGDIADSIINYIDYDAMARDLGMDYTETDKGVFRCP